MAYEKRYRKVYEAGVGRWGHSPDDEELRSTLIAWVDKNNLRGKRIIEFACGEGASGIILSELGCIYHGVDISPSAVEKGRAALIEYPDAVVSLLDMVNHQIDGTYDAGLDVMGLHMLITDEDRNKYLKNAYACLKNGAPMLFFRESFRVNAYDGTVESFDEWKSISGSDYDKPEKRVVQNNGKDIEVYIPLIPARAKTKEGYEAEMKEVGFVIDRFREMEIDQQIVYSATFYVHKP